MSFDNSCEIDALLLLLLLALTRPSFNSVLFLYVFAGSLFKLHHNLTMLNSLICWSSLPECSQHGMPPKRKDVCNITACTLITDLCPLKPQEIGTHTCCIHTLFD